MPFKTHYIIVENKGSVHMLKQLISFELVFYHFSEIKNNLLQKINAKKNIYLVNFKVSFNKIFFLRFCYFFYFAHIYFVHAATPVQFS